MGIVRVTIAAFQTSIFLVVCGLGLKTDLGDVLFLFQRRSLLARSLLAMNVAMPLLAMLITIAFDLPVPVQVALLFMALSPVPSLLPPRQDRAGGTSGYACGLLFIEAFLSILLVPVTVMLLAGIFHRDLAVPLPLVIKVLLMTVLLPLGAGMLIRRFARTHADRLKELVSAAGSFLLFVSGALLLLLTLPVVIHMIGNGTVLALAGFVIGGMVIGHWAGGPEHADRTTLALVTAARHPGVAISISGAAFPAQRKAIAAVVVLYLLTKVVILIPYNAWRKRTRPLVHNRNLQSDSVA